MNTHQKSHYVLAAFLALVAAFPLVTGAEGKVLVDASVTNAPLKHEAAPATKVALKLSNLDDNQAGLLRRYQRAHACPDSMDEILPGFKVLCLSVMPDVPAAITSVVQARVKATQGPKKDGAFTLDELIDAKRGARPVR